MLTTFQGAGSIQQPIPQMASFAVLLLSCLATFSGASLLVSSPGDIAVIPGWDLQSTAKVVGSLSNLSQSSFDSSSWHHVGSRATVMAGLIEAGVYNVSELWYSSNLEKMVNYTDFSVPWLYRQGFALQPGTGKHFFLQTNGITPKADVWLNGHEIASHLVQVGAYGGQQYDVTKFVRQQNALAVQVYPTDYNKDFGLGFVDWNPYPPDKGSGIWRNITLKQTGPVALGTPRILTDFVKPGTGSVTVTLKAEVSNLENNPISGNLTGVVIGGDGRSRLVSQTFKLDPSSTKTVALNVTVQNPQVWWPKQWGAQPLYSAQITVRTNGEVSDQSKPQNFGIRHITSHVNQHNDTIFQINGRPFQVLGGGYAPDQFLRWDSTRFADIARYVLDMGLNTIRLEGKEEQPELYELADRMGLMVLPGWECCDKWEAWSYNDEITPNIGWDAGDYRTANVSMRHEAGVLQSHVSVLAFLVGSDYWPDDRAAAIYVAALRAADWQNPIVCSAAKRGYPKILGPSGMKMAGPYDWVPPNYWYGDQVGAAFGFGSELGAGVGTPEMGSLTRFLSRDDLEDLWMRPNKGLYHMSTNVSQFHNRTIYNTGLYRRYGKPTSLSDYLLKAQMMDYEATRAQHEGFAAKWNAERPATGTIYWMLNNAWPSLHWNQFDYYLHPAASYFGTKVGSRSEHVAYDYQDRSVYLINHSLNKTGARSIDVQLIDLNGNLIAKSNITTQTVPNTSIMAGYVSGVNVIKDVAFLRLVLSDAQGTALSRNVYWITPNVDKLVWSKSTWWYTPVSSYVNYTALQHLKPAAVATSVSRSGADYVVTLENKSNVPAFFVRLNLVDGTGNDIVPVHWSDNYVTLFPREALALHVSWSGSSNGAKVQMSGGNVANSTISLVKA